MTFDITLPMSVTKSQVRTWEGRAGTTFTLHFDSSSSGKRVQVIRWHSSGRVELRAIKGDGRTPNFHEFGREDFVADCSLTDEAWRDRAAALARALASKYFA